MTEPLGDRIRARRDGLLGVAQTTAQSYTDAAMNALLTASQQWITPQDELGTELGDSQSVYEAIAASVTGYVDTKIADVIAQTNAYTDAAIAKLVTDNNLQS